MRTNLNHVGAHPDQVQESLVTDDAQGDEQVDLCLDEVVQQGQAQEDA